MPRFRITTRRGLALVLTLATNAACVAGRPPIVSSQGPFGQTLPPTPAEQKLELAITIDPLRLPGTLPLASSLFVRVSARLKTGAPCSSCTMTWYVDPPSAADVSVAGGAERGEAVSLKLLRPGPLTLAVDICPGGTFSCERQVLKTIVQTRKAP